MTFFRLNIKSSGQVIGCCFSCVSAASLKSCFLHHIKRIWLSRVTARARASAAARLKTSWWMTSMFPLSGGKTRPASCPSLDRWADRLIGWDPAAASTATRSTSSRSLGLTPPSGGQTQTEPRTISTHLTHTETDSGRRFDFISRIFTLFSFCFLLKH